MAVNKFNSCKYSEMELHEEIVRVRNATGKLPTKKMAKTEIELAAANFCVEIRKYEDELMAL